MKKNQKDREVELEDYIEKRAGKPTKLQKKIVSWCKKNPEKVKSGVKIEEICRDIGIDPNNPENVEKVKITIEKMNALLLELWEQFKEGSITIKGKKYSDFKRK